MIREIIVDSHERLINFEDKEVGLFGFIAIHNTALGPATGGTRFKVYDEEEDAINDALRLSKAMTYKCALAGVPYGGGKSVVMSSGRKDRELLESYARIINSLGGRFTTGKDVGIGDEDIAHMSRVSPHISNRVGAEDPSLYAALGVFLAIRAAAKSVYGSEDLAGKVVSIKGLGQVGYELARLVNEAGGSLIVADVDENKVRSAKEDFNDLEVASPAEIHKMKADIYAPCALGGEFNPQTAGEVGCDIICGAANNQLTSYDVGEQLMKRGVIYVPDYVANAGGLIAVVDGFGNTQFDDSRIRKHLGVIGGNVAGILERSAAESRPSHAVADEMAESIFMRR